MDKELIYFKPRNQERTPRPGQTRRYREPLTEGGLYRFVNGHLELVKPEAGTAPEPLTLRPGAFYKSRDGRKIQIWAINSNSVDKPAVGMILTGEEWKAWYWNLEGIAKVPYGAPNDIVAEWSDS